MLAVQRQEALAESVHDTGLDHQPLDDARLLQPGLFSSVRLAIDTLKQPAGGSPQEPGPPEVAALELLP